MEKKAKILLIDDDPDFVEATKTILESKPYEVIVSSEGNEGLKKASTENPDLILLDIIMPELTGVETLEYMKSIGGLGDTTVIMCTAEGNVKTLQKAMQLGASDFIRKPFDLNTVMQKTRKWLSSKT